MMSLNGKRVLSTRLLTPWTGVWLADVDLDDEALPSGAVVLEVGGAKLSGTVDPRASSRMGTRCGVRVLGGGAGWHHMVKPRHFHNDAGVTRSSILQATAAEVGERVVDPELVRLGVDFVRAAGLASHVLARLAWYVDDAGVTHVGDRVEKAAPSGLAVQTWEPTTQCLQVSSDELVRPGWRFTDSRFADVVARDVEQTFSAAGARATVWCGESPASRLASALGAAVEAFGRTKHLRAAPYRVFLMAPDGRVQLQAVEKRAGFPDAIPVPMRMGIPGAKAKLKPGALVLVEFELGDQARPSVRAFEAAGGDGWRPEELELDAKTLLRLGETSGAVVGPGAGTPVALAAPLEDWAAQVIAACAAHVPPIVIPPLVCAAGKLRTS